MKRASQAIVLSIIVLFAAVSFAAPSAQEIIDKSYNHQVMDHDSAEALMDMYLIEGEKIVQERSLKVRAKNIVEKNEKLMRVIMHFTAPADIKGTSFLSMERSGGDDDQFLFLPALNKVLRKGGTSGKDESFMGTQFTYGDMESKEVDKAVHKSLPDEKIGPVDCYVVESIPNDPKEEGYGKYITYVNKTNFVPMRIKLFDLKGKLFKVMMTEKVEKINGKDTMTTMVMLNVKNKKATRMVLHDINTKIKLSDSDFSKERMTKL